MSALSITNTQPQPVALVPNGSTSGNGITFGDVLDAVNPLQHIPVVSSIYRAVSGSQISTGSQLAGDAIYGTILPGGIVANLASSLANAAVKQVTGKDIGGQIVSALGSVTASVSSAVSGASPTSAATATASPATPLIPGPIAAAAQAASTNVVPIPLIRHAAHSPDHQYQRAAALDSINKRLVKMAI